MIGRKQDKRANYPTTAPPSFSNYKLHVCRHEISFNHRKVSNRQCAPLFCNSLRDRSCPCVAEQGEKVKEGEGSCQKEQKLRPPLSGKKAACLSPSARLLPSLLDFCFFLHFSRGLQNPLIQPKKHFYELLNLEVK